MIVKSLDPFVPTNAREAAGQKAEQEMAFYLRRAFKDSPEFWVFNGLRFVFGEETAQIDHLVLHRYGVIIIESKSVTTRVQVNEHGEWTRGTGASARGIPSPVLQARRQGEFLKRYLNAHAADLLGKVLGLQRRFGGMSVDILVAVSDRGIIVRPRRNKAAPPPEVNRAGLYRANVVLHTDPVCKADQVSDRVGTIYERHQKANSLSGFVLGQDGGYWWSSEDLTRLREFLVTRHQPVREWATSLPKQPAAASVPPAVVSHLPATRSVCAVCGVAVSEGVARFCRDHAARFGWRVLCFVHQQQDDE